MQLDNFKNNILQDINNAGLPVDAVYFVLKDILNDVTNLYNQTIERENAEAVAQKSGNPDSSSEEAAAAEENKKEEE